MGSREPDIEVIATGDAPGVRPRLQGSFDLAGFPTVVLAGGEGRRMGGAKPLRMLRGTSLIDRACALARSWSVDVAVAVRDPRQVGRVDATILNDPADIEGPLAGLAAALSWACGLGHDRVLVIPCDMPGLPSDLADRLDHALGPGDGAAVPRSGARLHPACALWRTATLDMLNDQAARGSLSLRQLSERAGCAVVDWADGRAFVNLNTARDLEYFEATGCDGSPRAVADTASNG